MVLTLEQAGSSWNEITPLWEKLTKNKSPGKSTLPNRYQRLKDNFVVVREEDNVRIIEAKKQVDAEFEVERWERVAQVVANNGGDTYEVSARLRYAHVDHY